MTLPGEPTDGPTAFGRECLASDDGQNHGLRAGWQVFCKFEKGHEGDHSWAVPSEEDE